MKKYNKWRKLNEEVAQQVQEPKEKTFSTNINTTMKISSVLDMIAYSISTFGKQKALSEGNSMKIGNIYLYTNKDGEKYPIRILSLSNEIEMKGGVPFYKGDEGEEIKDGNAFVQTTSVGSKNTDSPIITGKNSYSLTVKKDRLSTIEPGSTYDWFNMSVNKLEEVIKKIDKKEQKYIKVFIKTLRNLTTNFDDANATLKNLLDFEYFNSKQTKEPQKEQNKEVQKTEKKPVQNKQVQKTEKKPQQVQKQPIQKQSIQKQSIQKTVQPPEQEQV